MSVPPPYAQRNAPAESKEDCRDYLRTGRCKYGASCKYSHPLNVQSGGGMKSPVDPTEPLFPVRINEPPCQYFMKHGTCKFGQACKFNHPPQLQLAASTINGNAQIGAVRKTDAPQILWNTAAVDSNAQLLPQRPDEPNCIFFLKNGRCKYGSTCRYHHPLNYHDRRQYVGDDGRRQQIHAQNDNPPKVHYVTSLPPGSYQQGHFVVSDGTVTFLSLDGPNPTQVMPVPQGSKETVVYTSAPPNAANRPLGQSREFASTSSASIASSYETANSNMDMIGQLGDSSSSLWNRPMRSSSSNSLGAYNIPDGNSRQHVVHGGRTVLVQNMGDNPNIPRVASTASTLSENGSVYFDANQGHGRYGSIQHVQVSNGGPWRGRRSDSFDRTATSGGYHAREEEFDRSGHARSHEGQISPMVRGRHPPGGRRRGTQPGEIDDGLSMMTSALLNMMDTPEEAASEQYDGYYDEQSVPSSQTSTPQMRPEFPPLKHDDDLPNSLEDARLFQTEELYPPQSAYYDSNIVDDRVLGLVNRSDPPYDSNGYPPSRHAQATREEFPHWQSHEPLGRPFQENAQSMSVVQQRPPPTDSHHSSSNVGLYLS